MTINKIIKEVKKSNPGANISLIRHAHRFALSAHKKQKRENGEAYIEHPLNTAFILAQMKMDTPTVTAALLHDVIDDTPHKQKVIKEKFGEEIAFLVKGVTKLGKIKYHGLERQVENLRKIFLAMAKDIRIILIKLADRLHNMKTLDALPKRKQKRIAQETIEIYAPIAYRLGIGRLKGELEDLAFPYIYPKEYDWLIRQVQTKYQEREAYLKRVRLSLKKMLAKEKIIPIDIHSRAKHYYSLWEKLERYNMNFSKVYDLVALRIIVKNPKDCYNTLGIIHKKWKPLPGRIKDYIAAPKPNGYQSLHTTIFCLDGKIIEIQIRTPKMHWEAEYGVAAYWQPRELRKPKLNLIPRDKKLEWVKQLKDWQKNVKKSREFLDSLRLDFFENRIFVSTPKGEVVNLPEGATPVDFAYHIHEELGHRCGGAKVDGQPAPLFQPLQNAQMVEIIVHENAQPSQKWLKFVKTNYAKNKIKDWFKDQKLPSRPQGTYLNSQTTNIEVLATDRIGLIRDVTNVISKEKINIHSINTSEPVNGMAVGLISLQVPNTNHLKNVLKRLKKVKGVWNVKQI